jgi:hypothetical protein
VGRRERAAQMEQARVEETVVGRTKVRASEVRSIVVEVDSFV